MAVMMILSGFLLWGVPGLSLDVKKIFTPVSFSIVDLDDSLLSRKLSGQIKTIELVEEVYVEPMADAQKRLAEDKSLLIIVIPADFFEISLSGKERPPIEVYLNSRKPVETALFVRFLNSLASNIERVQSSYYSYMNNMRPLYDNDEQFANVMNGASTSMILQMLGRLAVIDVDESDKLNTVHFVIAALLCLMAMQTCVLLLTQVQQERRRGIFERLLLTGVSWWQPILARQLTGLFLLAIGFAPLLSGLFLIFPNANVLTIIAAILILYWITALLCQSLGYLGKAGDISLLGAWLGILALMLIGGSIYPDALLPSLLRDIGQASPVYWTAKAVYGGLDGDLASTTTWLVGGLMIVVTTTLAALSWRRAQVAIHAEDKA